MDQPEVHYQPWKIAKSAHFIHWASALFVIETSKSQSVVVLLTNTPAKSVPVGHILGLVGA